MAYENFKPTIWSKTIELELAPLMIFRDVVNTKYKGLVGKGKTVKILNLANPTIKDYVPGEDIDAPETPNDDSIELKIDQYKYFNVTVDDVDDAQADVDTMKALCKGGATGLAAKADAYIAAQVVNCHEDNLIASTAVTTEKQAKAIIDDMFELVISDFAVRSNANREDVRSLEEKVDTFRTTNLENHIHRMNKGECNPESGGIYVNTINNLERAADHLVFITDRDI